MKKVVEQTPAEKAAEKDVKQLDVKAENVEAPKLSPEEEKFLQERRSQQQKLIQCTQEVNTVLKKYNASIIVDPHSPVGSPRVKVNLN